MAAASQTDDNLVSNIVCFPLRVSTDFLAAFGALPAHSVAQQWHSARVGTLPTGFIGILTQVLLAF